MKSLVGQSTEEMSISVKYCDCNQAQYPTSEHSLNFTVLGISLLSLQTSLEQHAQNKKNHSTKYLKSKTAEIISIIYQSF